ncbi:focadhesin [Biomphalaria glabrata]|nr:focadhesin [Biomphalaria glabrata]
MSGVTLCKRTSRWRHFGRVWRFQIVGEILLAASDYLCLCKLSQDLLKKCTTRVQEGNQEIPELKQLLDCLGSADSLESQLSGQVILHLVETDVLDLTLALNSTLNSVPSCKNLIGAVETVFGLLLLESKAVLASETVYRCPYTLSFSRSMLPPIFPSAIVFGHDVYTSR